jgi:hypothetical protein
MRLVLTLIVIGSSAVASADEVWLKGGGRLVGDVREKRPNAVVLDVGAGTVTLPLSRVERIVSSTVAITEYRERAAKLAATDLAGWTALAQWAEQNDLRTLSREAWRRVLQVDPANAVAHLALGDVLYQGRWLDFASVQRARGLIEQGGVWMTPAEREAALRQEAADAVARQQAQVAAIERQEAEARVREAEARARTAEAEAERAENDGYADGIPVGYGGYGWGVPVIGPIVPPCGVHGVGCPGTPGRPGHGDGRPGHGKPDVRPTPQPPPPQPTPQPPPPARSAHRGLRSNDR